MPSTAKSRSPLRVAASTTVPAGARVAATAAQAVSTSRRRFLRGTAGSAGALLAAGFGGSLLSACGGSLEADQPQTPRLASVSNFRDLGGAGAGYLTVDGKQMRRGVFYRANALTLSGTDAATLDKLGIVAVYDLRTPAEIARSADRLPLGATSSTLNVLGTPDFMTPALDTPEAAAGFMQAQARAYVTGGAQREAFGALLSALADGTGAQLFHSSAGKDRAGWVAALLLGIANVPLDVIMQDYLLSNVYLARSIAARTALLRAQQGEAVAMAETPLLTVDENYLQAGFDQVQASYGTMANYLTLGLGLSQTQVDSLRSRLVH
ncbi:tyrosine-protein phosphatase [Paraburkholderia sp. MMS20-SJTR3]|uniref:Tyrosine-protein phosphatase n=1 Tax=Paraburkholderia sejongensis TaxID=2886946 RepID=A0ABS8K3J5_9BURK|nr:tyrosine-protein phosphatase [Paraburkholderia sp. MMS20-SJTR3]MCC8396478.1 tyrosine-protein phosphatase [Paraburkholderia sp. MMS20-SJTR3]